MIGSHDLFTFNSNHLSICLHYGDIDDIFSRSRPLEPTGQHGPMTAGSSGDHRATPTVDSTSSMGFLLVFYMSKSHRFLPLGHGTDTGIDRLIAS